MQLSRKLFAEITGVQLGECLQGEVDRRAHRRVAFDFRARIFPLMEGAGEAGNAVLLRDISVMGIGFLAPDPISIGDEFVVRLPTTNEKPVDIQCAARRCELGGTCGSQFVVGATFELVLDRPLSDAVAPESEVIVETEPLVDQPAPQSIEERFDRLLQESRLIRPTTRQTAWDHFLARPLVKKATGLLNYVLWPMTAVGRALKNVLPERDGMRLRHRLTPSKAAKRARRKAKAAARAAVPIQAETTAVEIPPTPAIAQAAQPGAHHLFELVQPDAGVPSGQQVSGNQPTATTAQAGKKSIFLPRDTAHPEPAALEPAMPAAVPTAQIPTVTAPLAPVTAAAEPAPTIPAAAVTVTLPTAAAESVELPGPAAGGPTLQTPKSVVIAQVPAEPAAPEPKPELAAHGAENDVPSEPIHCIPLMDVDRNDSSPKSARKPVAHPRHARRRPKSSFHR